MAVAKEEQRSGLKNGKVKSHPLAELVVIHVAAVRAKFPGQNGLPGRRGDANTAEKGLQGNRETFELVGRLCQGGDATLAIQPPGAIEVIVGFGFVPGIESG